MDPRDIEVTHAAPGRIRLHVPGLWSDPERANDIHRSLDAYPGVEAVKLGLLGSTVTVDFNPADAESVVECLAQLFPGAGLEELDLRGELALTEDSQIDEPGEHGGRPTREAVRARATARRRNLASVGLTVAGVVAGLVLRRLLRPR